MRITGSVLIACVAVALIGGFAVGISVYSWLGKERTVQLPVPGSASTEQILRSNPISLDDTHEVPSNTLNQSLRVQSLLESTKLKSDFDQSVSLYLLLANAGKRDLERYISESFSISSKNQRSEAQKIIFGRYAALDPHEAIDQALALDQLTVEERSNLIRSIFIEWTAGDLEAAIAAIDNLPEAYKNSAASAVMWRNDSLSMDQRIRLAQEIGPSGGWITNTVKSIRVEAAKADPRAAFYARILDKTDLRQHDGELISIAKHWVEAEGADVLSEVSESLDDRIVKRSVVHSLIWSSIAAGVTAPIDVMRVVSEFPNNQEAKAAMQTTFEIWSYVNPRESFEHSFEVGGQVVNREFRKQLLYSWARSNADGLLVEAPSLPSDYEDVAVVFALGQIARETPERAIRIARNLDTREQRTQARDEIVRRWSSVNAKAALDWLIDDGFNIDHQNETSIFERAFSSYLNRDFESAENFASNYQGTLRNLFVEAVASHLISVDVEQAIDYLPNVNRENRNSLQIDIGEKLVDVDPLKALSYGESVEKSRRSSYYKKVLEEWADDDLFALHRNIQRVPREYRPYAAETLLSANESERALSDRQIQSLESMVSKREVQSSSFSGTIQIDNNDEVTVQITRR